MNDRSLSSFPRRLVRAIVALLRKSVLLVLLVVVAIVVGRAYLSTSGPPLRPWHTIVPEELSARAIEHEDWRGWIAAENTMFEDLHRRLQAAMDAGVALSCNLTSGVYVNQSAAFSDFHGTGANPAANASYTDGAYVASRFRIVQSRRHR